MTEYVCLSWVRVIVKVDEVVLSKDTLLIILRIFRTPKFCNGRYLSPLAVIWAELAASVLQASDWLAA